MIDFFIPTCLCKTKFEFERSIKKNFVALFWPTDISEDQWPRGCKDHCQGREQQALV